QRKRDLEATSGSAGEDEASTQTHAAKEANLRCLHRATTTHPHRGLQKPVCPPPPISTIPDYTSSTTLLQSEGQQRLVEGGASSTHPARHSRHAHAAAQVPIP
ncbi:hypothetical protein GE061_006917, partial [Apolygus lucorum]